MGPATDRQLQQEEAIETAWIDRHRTAIGDVIDRKAVEGGAVVQRMKIALAMPQRVERVRTEYPSDRRRGLVDIGGADATKGLKPRAGRGRVASGGGCIHGPIARFI
jgi:hypothetical protein